MKLLFSRLQDINFEYIGADGWSDVYFISIPFAPLSSYKWTVRINPRRPRPALAEIIQFANELLSGPYDEKFYDKLDLSMPYEKAIEIMPTIGDLLGGDREIDKFVVNGHKKVLYMVLK